MVKYRLKLNVRERGEKKRRKKPDTSYHRFTGSYDAHIESEIFEDFLEIYIL